MGKKLEVNNNKYIKYILTFVFLFIFNILNSNVSLATSVNKGRANLQQGRKCSDCKVSAAIVRNPKQQFKTTGDPLYTYLMGEDGDPAIVQNPYFTNGRDYHAGKAVTYVYDSDGNKKLVKGKQAVANSYKQSSWCVTIRWTSPRDSAYWQPGDAKFQYDWTKQLRGMSDEAAEEFMLRDIKKADPNMYKLLKDAHVFDKSRYGQNEIKTVCSNELEPPKPLCKPGEEENEDCQPPIPDEPLTEEDTPPGNPPGRNPGGGVPPNKPRKIIDKLKPRGGGNIDPTVPSSGSGPCQRSDYESKWIKQKIYGGKYPQTGQHLAMTEYRHVVKPVKSEGLMEVFEEKEEKGYIKSAQEQMAEWNSTHHEETLPKGWPVKTEYFKQLEKFDSQNLSNQIKRAGTIEVSKTKVDDAANKINKALEKDEKHIKALDKSEDIIKLSESNQKGLARGGAFTVTKQIKEERTTLQTQEERKFWIYCTESKDSNDNVYHHWNKRVTKKRIVKESDDFFYNHKSLTGGGYVPFQSYQIVNTLCSKKDLETIGKQAEADYGKDVKLEKVQDTEYGLLMKTTPTEDWTETTLLTPKNMHARLFYDGKCYDKSRLDPKDPSEVTEDPNNKETGKLVCSSNPSKVSNTKDGANNKQDKNKPQTGKDKDLFGAQFKDEESDELKEKNSGQFQFFRDNQLREIRTDVWSVAGKNGNKDIQLKPTYRTDIILWDGSTPDPFGKNFEIQVNDQKVDWDKGTKVEEGVSDGVKGHDGEEYKSGYLKSFDNEEINKFKYAASWASEGGSTKEESRPTRMEITYSYDPILKTNKIKEMKMHEPKESLLDEGRPVVTPAYDDQKIDTSCDVFFNDKEDKKPRIGIFPKYEKNNPEKRKYQEGFSDKKTNQEIDQHRNGGSSNEKTNTNNELTVNFVKTSKE